MSKKKNISFETYIPQGRFEKSKILNQNKTKIYKSLENKKREIEFKKIFFIRSEEISDQC